MADHDPNAPHQRSNPHALNSPYQSLSATSNPSRQIPTTEGMSSDGLTRRPSNGPDTAHPYQPPLRPGSETRSASYTHSYESFSTSPSLLPQGYSTFDPGNESGSGTPDMPNTHVSTGFQAQKRAYRQRRKDPSCDACRERKVKCDATDTTSCSECSSRNVKCQFTKETNRRMSSIKQVQDLEKQLAYARHQLAHFRSGPADELYENAPDHPSSQPPKSGSHRSKRQKSIGLLEFTCARNNLLKYGRGLLNLPRLIGQSTLATSPVLLSDLPPRHMADKLLRSYHSRVHPTLPILHWPSFIHEFESVYREGSFRQATRSWCSLLFAVLALGGLAHSLEERNRYLTVSKRLIDLGTEDYSLDHARCATLISVFLVEMNLKSEGWIWLGIAFRISQELGLYSDSGNWAASEQEMRRHVWWSIYACDRLMSLEFGKPCMINDEDCEVELPVAKEDVKSGPNTSWNLANPSPSISPFLSTLRVVREITNLLKTLKTSTISPRTLNQHDMRFNHCLASFPAHYQTRRPEWLDPHTITPMVYLQNARLLLHRHNLSILCSPDARAAAIDQCCLVAKDTTQLLSRCMIDSPEPPNHPQSGQHTWKGLVRNAASAFLCTHIWRCTLFLCLRGEYSAASICVRVSAAIGDARPVNVACGRYLDFFLDHLIHKMRLEPTVCFEPDEETIAYLSGDLQGSVDHSWVWQSDEDFRGRITQSPTTRAPADRETSTVLGIGSDDDFGQTGWDGILEKLGPLLDHGRPRKRQPYVITPVTSGDAARGPSSNPSVHPPGLPTGTSRISIADIM